MPTASYPIFSIWDSDRRLSREVKIRSLSGISPRAASASRSLGREVVIYAISVYDVKRKGSRQGGVKDANVLKDNPDDLSTLL